MIFNQDILQFLSSILKLYFKLILIIIFAFLSVFRHVHKHLNPFWHHSKLVQHCFFSVTRGDPAVPYRMNLAAGASGRNIPSFATSFP